MPTLSKLITIGGALLLAASVAAAPPQRPRPRPSQEVLDARARQEREWEEIMERVRAADEAYRIRWEKIFEETREEREVFDRAMRDYSDRFSKPASTTVQTTMNIGEDGLPESGEVWWVNTRHNLITHRASFDADGNTDGFVQTPDGRALESLDTYVPRDSGTAYRYHWTADREGRDRIGQIDFSNPDQGRSGSIRFNHDGVPFWGEFFTDGVRSGGFYDPSLETADPPPRDLQVPPLVRPVTQPCDECRDVAGEHNDIVRQMAEMRAEIVQLADDNQTTSPGLRRQAIEARHEVLMNRWTGLAPAYEDVLARLRDCTETCNRPEPENAVALPDAFLAPTGDGSSARLAPPTGPTSDVFQFMIIVQPSGGAQNPPPPRPMHISMAWGPAAPRPLLAGGQQGSVQELAMSLIATGASSGTVFDVFATGLDALAGGRGGGGGRGSGGAGRGGRGGAGVFDIIAPDGLVVEPLAESAAQALPQLPGDLVKQLMGFCLDFAKPPPRQGTPYQIAPQSLQQQFRPLRHVMSTAQRLSDLGLLNPDSDAAGYLTFIKQWSLWSTLEQWDQAGFASAFLEHTREAVEASGGNWTDQAADIVRGAVPNRWQDIQRVVGAALPLVEQERGRRP